MKVFEPLTLDAQWRAWLGNLKRSRQLKLATVEIDHQDALDDARVLCCDRDLLRQALDEAAHRAANAYDRREKDWRRTAAGRRRFDRFLRQRTARQAEKLRRLDRRIEQLQRPVTQGRREIEHEYERILAASHRRFKKLTKGNARVTKNPG